VADATSLPTMRMVIPDNCVDTEPVEDTAMKVMADAIAPAVAPTVEMLIAILHIKIVWN